MSEPKEGGSSSHGGFSGLIGDLREKLHDTKLHDAKVQLIHKKNQIGKLGNLFNKDHRHDEEHEQRCDEKRTAICQSHRFESFFPERDGNLIKWYVDGRDYFWAVSVALEQAQESIYLADWWISPELFLRRPPYHKQEYRLDQVLKRRAEAGVKIYIIVYKEVEAALTCNSRHTKHALQALCPEGSPGHGNIRVLRHPDHNVFENAADMTMYWAHHEKFIVIDYAMAFIGGLDLCFGRWDARQHPLSDVHPEGVSEEIFPGQDFNNNRIMDFQKVQDWQQNELSKAEYGRMPWHDVAMAVVGPCVYDIAEHFVLRWNFVKRDKYKRDERYDWIILEGREGDDEDLSLDNRGTVHAQVVRSSADWSSGILTDHSIQNAYCDVIRKAEHYVYIENQFFITATGDQQTPIHNTIGSAIVEAVVRAGKEGRKFRVIVIIPAIPGFAGDLRENAASGTRAIMDYQYKSICRGENSIFERVKAQGVDPTQHIFFFNLRSYDRLNKTHAISEAEKKTGISYQQVQRAEAEEIMAEGVHGYEDDSSDDGKTHRMRRHGHKSSSTPPPQEPSKDALQASKIFEEAKPDEKVISAASVAHHAMCGQGSLKDEPWDSHEDPESEIRNWIQEELYIHAKLLIADDRIVICGSSNLNDRSQLGDHDSELSIVMEDTKRLASTMDGKPFEVGYHAATLRRYLWREHMGLLPPQPLDADDDVNAQPPTVNPENNIYGDEDSYKFVEDPMSDDLWDMWTGQADRNTHLFRHLFHADPDDHIKTFEDYDRYLPPRGVKSGHIYDQFMPPEDAREKLDQIKGHLVWMPMKFLQDVEMAERGLQVNSWTESVYT
ncbi:PLD-like domain-containing protein [Hirsutella rhossiliensis]|uniref:Phospholipase n=1 Tax=Hirsutella rhossiliensis TaxID=111463 RepID=A0A9P8MYR9_9HYPO|nr:PLD-like domain-containing protein [Hirsutella rhossiliensis]KAH0964513.1 PLD-like domain-containing protein [Hirsutella rhossiliensis]